MEIKYKNSKLEKECKYFKIANKKYGSIVANNLIILIELLEDSENLFSISQLRRYNLHELKGERVGEYSIYLGKTTGYRLIIKPITENIDKSNLIEYYKNIEIISIEEVSKHYE